MRRLASVFVSKRDRSDANYTPAAPATQSSSRALSLRKGLRRGSTLNVSTAVPPARPSDSAPSTPGLSARSDPANSSASSSGSASLVLQTPEPDDDPSADSTPTVKEKSWKSWLSKRSGTIKLRPPISNQPPITQWQSAAASQADTDDEDESDNASVDSYVSEVRGSTNSPSSPSRKPPSFLLSKQNLVNITQNRLRPRYDSSPFVYYPRTPLFPRSSNLFPIPVPHHSLRVDVHRNNLVGRLQASSPITLTEEQSILPFAERPVPGTSQTGLNVLSPDAVALPKDVKPSPFSAGLHRWINRPCFEDRYMVQTLNDAGEMVSTRVGATTFAVAELEYSDTLLTMIPPDSPRLETPQTTLSNPSSSNVSLVVTRTMSYAPSSTPSPLRMGHGPEPSPSRESAPEEKAEVVEKPPVERVKRGVRFAEDDKEDVIPIGYVLRLKEQKAQKAKFLQEEKERRAFEAERARVEAERMQRERERREWENERKAWEAEKKAMEDERKQRLFAEEVIAARSRRETQRQGFVPGNSSPTSSNQDTEIRKRESKKVLRPVYDSQFSTPRRQASEPNPATPSPSSDSPGSSRPPSVVGQSSLRVPKGSAPRPSSTYSSSSEDHRPKDAGSKRNSVDRSSYGGTWSGSNPNLVPPLPSLPPSAYPLDMPLLPPTAPFMLQEYPRSRSRDRDRSNSSSRSSPKSPSLRNLSNNGSSERITPSSPHRTQSSSSRERDSKRRSTASDSHSRPPRISSHSSLSPPADGNNSGGSSSSSGHGHGRGHAPNHRSHSTPQPPSVSQPSRSQPNSVSRGRPMFPMSYSQPVVYSWNAFPPQYGMPIAPAMPVPNMAMQGMPMNMNRGMMGMAPNPSADGHQLRATPPTPRRQSTIS